MGTQSHPVPCGRCGRTVAVAVGDRHPPCFRHVEEQAECPEIQERRRRGEGMLLLMMCSALEQSLETELASIQIEAVERDGAWHVACRSPGDSGALYSLDLARRQADFWQGRGQASLSDRFRAAAAEAERQQLHARPWMARSLQRRAGILALSVIVIAVGAATGWQMMKPRTEQTSAELQASAPAVEDMSEAGRGATVASPASEMTLQGAVTTAQATLPQDSAPATPPTPTAPENLATPSPPQAVAPTVATGPSSSEPGGEPEMVPLPGGTFTMGSNDDPSEMPIHQITIKPFAISRFPITVREWSECVAAKACAYVPDGAGDAAVANLSWNDAQQFITWLTQTTQKSFRLPSEAEWEYAARGRTTTKFWWGEHIQAGMAGCRGCGESREATQPAKVGSFKPNPFGLFDMGGSIGQWVNDCWHKNYQGAPTDGSSWVERDCESRVVRSGSWKNDPSYVRPASRDHYDMRVRYPTHGFRVVRSL